MKLSLHQPNFFPYYPFFQKMEESDIFLIMFHCQYENRNYQNRFNIAESWYTMSVNKGTQIQNNSSPSDSIFSKKYVNYKNDWDKIKNRLPQYKTILDEFDNNICESLSETNISIILKIKKMLDIKTPIVFDYPTDLRSTDRILDFCEKYNATEYYSGISGANYLNIENFNKKNIKLSFQEKDKMNSISILEKLKTLI